MAGPKGRVPSHPNKPYSYPLSTSDSLDILVDAANVQTTPAGNLSATDAQAALTELDTEKVAKAGDTMSGSLLPNADGTLNIGSAVARWNALYVKTLNDGSGIQRITITGGIGTQIRGDAVDGAAAVAHKLVNQASLTTSGAKILSIFSDNGVTERLSVDRIGSVIPTTDAGPSLGGPSNRFNILSVLSLRANLATDRLKLNTAGGGSSNDYWGAVSDAAAVVANRIGNTTTLTPGADRSIAGFYNDAAFANLKLSIASNGSPIPGSDNAIDLGTSAARFANLFATGWKDGGGIFRLIIGNSTLNDYRSTVADGSSAVAHKFRNTNALSTGGAKIAQFFKDDGTTEVFAIDKDGSAISVAGTGNLGTTTKLWPDLYLSGSISDGTTARFSVFNPSIYRGNATDAAASVMHQFGNSISMTAGADRYIARFYRDSISTPMLNVQSDGFVSQTATASGVTVGSAAGVSSAYSHRLSEVSYKVTVDKAAFTAAALTQDITLLTIPAKARVYSIVSDCTQAFAGTGLTGTIQARAGITAGGQEYLLAHDVKTAAVVKGNADADLGTSINRANAVQGGHTPSWTATTTIQMRLASSVGNLGTGAATNLTAGSITFYITLLLQ